MMSLNEENKTLVREDGAPGGIDANEIALPIAVPQ